MAEIEISALRSRRWTGPAAGCDSVGCGHRRLSTVRTVHTANTVTSKLREAEDAGRRLGRDDNAHWTGFGPTNVAQHRVHVAMKLGDAGTAPAQALWAATLEPARSLGRRDHGTVERGKVADLVLLDADPLRDITNTTRINSVFVGGCLIDPTARQRMLAEIEAAARDKASTGVMPAAAGCACHGGPAR